MKAKLAGICLIGASIGLIPAAAQTAGSKPVDHGSSYYHFSMGHLYSELAQAYGNRNEYINEAIDHYRQALQADPGAAFITEELADLYIQGNRSREGIAAAEATIRDNPKDANAHRILGRLYMRLLSDSQRGRINETYLKRATDEFNQLVEIDPKDVDSWITLGRLQRVNQNSLESEKAFKKAIELESDNEEALAGLAMVYSDLGDLRRASELLKQVVEKDPNPRALTELANAYEQMHDYALASETLKRALELAPDNDEIKRGLAMDLMLADRLDDALKLYQEMVAEDPKDSKSYLQMSRIYREQKKYAEARKASDEAKKNDPDDIEIRYNEVGIYEAEGKLPEAIAALKDVVNSTSKRSYSASEKGNRAQLLERLGLLYRANRQFPDAVNTFRELAGLDPQLAAQGTARVIDTYRQAKDYTKALEESNSASKQWPDDRSIRAARASVLADTGKTAEAAAELKKLLDGKNDTQIWLNIAGLYEKSKNYTEMGKAIDDAEKTASTDEEKESVHFTRGAMFEKMKNLDKSEAEFRKVLAINPNSISTLNYLGYMLADRNVRLNEALDMIKKAVDKEPDNGAYLDSLGWVYFRLGRLDEAVDNLRKAVNSSEKDPTILDHLGDAYAKQGNLKDAAASWDQAIRVWGESPDNDAQEVAKVQKKLDSARVKLAREQQQQKSNQR